MPHISPKQALIPSSHLLLHDDSISSRLVSYILYLPNSPPSAPEASGLTPSATGSFLKGWNSEWGGALELYPVESGEEVGLPGTKRSAKVDVNWGQIIFFEVKPGRSYHSVEEVIVGDGRQRLGVSGWFHRPIEGEEGYVPEDKNAADLSSLAQIVSHFYRTLPHEVHCANNRLPHLPCPSFRTRVTPLLACPHPISPSYPNSSHHRTSPPVHSKSSVDNLKLPQRSSCTTS